MRRAAPSSPLWQPSCPLWQPCPAYQPCTPGYGRGDFLFTASHNRCRTVCEDAPHGPAAGGTRPGTARRGRGASGAGVRARRRGDGQDPHHHPPHRLPGPARARRPWSGARGHVHRAGGGGDAHAVAGVGRDGRAGPHVPRRRVAAAALLLAEGRRWRPVAARRGEAADRRAGREQGRGADVGGVVAGHGERDRVVEGLADHAGRLPGGRGEHAPGHAGARRPARPRLPGLRAAQEPRADARLRRPAAAHGRRAGGAQRGRRRVPRPVPVLRGRRVPGRHPVAAARARRVGRAARRPDRRRRRQPDHLLVRGRLAAAAARLRPPVPRGARGPAGARLPVDAAGRRARQRGDQVGAR